MMAAGRRSACRDITDLLVADLDTGPGVVSEAAREQPIGMRDGEAILVGG